MGTGDLSQVGGLVEEAFQHRRFQKRLELPERKGAVVDDVPQRLLNRPSRIKSFVPIQYGCDKFCTFCIVPTTRGRERSRSTTDIVEEVRSLASSGTKEVTLLGQTVNSYGKNLIEGRVPFSKLLQMLNDVEGLERIRYMSPYPRDFKTDLIETIRDFPKVMEHVHLPLQGGHDTLLQRMHRVYTVDGYLKIVDELRQTIPGVGLTTDIIVGFPEETDEEFEGTLEMVRKVRFDGAYMFIYSPRPGTPAADMNQIPLPVKKERLARLMELQNQITEEINGGYIGRELEVLIEGTSPRNAEMLQGYSREFKMVHFPGSADRTGRIARVRVTDSHVWGLSGELA
jgi:tRNA-2-methylthio-N6-dimethylallyladenosine synthase